MEATAQPSNAWAELPCVIVASGPSLTDVDCRAVMRARQRDACRVIVISDNWLKVPHADALYTCDWKWWNHHYKRGNLSRWTGARYTLDERAARDFGVTRLFGVDEPGLGKEPGVLHQGSNSGYQAINLAYHFGARRILLLGFDMQWTDGKAHWFGDHPSPLNNPVSINSWVPHFAALASDLASEGVEVINCTRQTALTCFVRSVIQQELGGRNARVKPQPGEMYVYSVDRERTSPVFAKAFAMGSGGLLVHDQKPRPFATWAGFGSPLTHDALLASRKAGGTWYYGDHGYFNRGKSYRITRNAFQHRGVGVPDFARLNITPKPWRRSGGTVLICPPDAGAAARGFDAEAWLANVLMRIRANSDRPIKVRERRDPRPLAADLKEAWALVTWASNAAVEAVMEGVPVFCTDDCAASAMGLTDPVNIEYPRYPDNREEWAAVLAANQWTMPEIESGMAWSHLNAI